MNEMRADVLIIGGGVGGVAAALAAAKLGRKVIMTEETDWIGGQLTAQAVPPDEHRWIEQFGATASYRQFRHKVRAYYRRNYPLTAEARERPNLNPGEALVSRLCHEPRVALAVLEEMLAPYRSAGLVDTLLHHEPIAVSANDDRIEGVVVRSRLSGRELALSAPFVIDATELGDLLELGGVEHVIGAESRAETGELNAPETANPMDQQAISWCFALAYHPDEDNTIEQPETYAFWRSYVPDFWPGPLLSWEDVYPHDLSKRHRAIFHDKAFHSGRDGSDYWHYRRILSRRQFDSTAFKTDITLVNWPQIDYWLKPLVGVSVEEKQAALDGARQLSLSMLYWMQTEAPRLDGGQGYRGLRLRPDIVGTEDGLAKSVYVRESRRIKAEFTVLEQHVGVDARPGQHGAESFHDSIGIGAYRIDLHPSTAGRNYVDVGTWPFQIPLGSLLPQRMQNLLAAGKNIGTTHITNGCYRLHPVEWNIGEAAGALAAHCLNEGFSPSQVRNEPGRMEDFQTLMSKGLGVELAWPKIDSL